MTAVLECSGGLFSLKLGRCEVVPFGSGQWDWLGVEKTIVQGLGFLVLLVFPGSILGRMEIWPITAGWWAIDTHTPPPLAPSRFSESVCQSHFTRFDKFTNSSMNNSWTHSSWMYSYEYVHCWIYQIYRFLLWIHSLNIEYSFKCKHILMNIFMNTLFLWIYLKSLHRIWEFSHLHWFPFNSCHLFCQHFSIFRRIPLQIFLTACQP